MKVINTCFLLTAPGLVLSEPNLLRGPPTDNDFVIIEGLRFRDDNRLLAPLDEKHKRQAIRHGDLDRTGFVPASVVRDAIDARQRGEKLKIRIPHDLAFRNNILDMWESSAADGILLDIEEDALEAQDVPEVDGTRSFDVKGGRVKDPVRPRKIHRFEVTCNELEEDCDVYSYRPKRRHRHLQHNDQQRRLDTECWGDEDCPSGEPFCRGSSLLFRGTCGKCRDDDDCDGSRCEWPMTGASYCYENETCFSPDSTVRVQERGSVPLSAVSIGDKVLTKSGTYKAVHSFAHRSLHSPSQFVELLTSTTSITLTPTHMVFLANQNHPVQASRVKLGDCLLLEDKKADCIVKSNKKVTKNGAIGPLTEDGTIIVDGIVASSYCNDPSAPETDFVTIGGFKVMSFHHYIHVIHSVSRLRYTFFGKSSDSEESQEVKLGMDLYHFITGMGAWPRLLMLVLAFAVTLPLYALEQLLVAAGVPAAVCLVAAGWYGFKATVSTTKVKSP